MLRQKEYFTRILSAYLIFAVLLVAMAVIPILSRYRYSMEQKILSQCLQAILSVDASLQSTCDEVTNLYYAVRVQTDVDTFLQGDTPSGSNLYRALLLARKTCFMNSYIHSVTLYNAKTNEFFTTGDQGIESAEPLLPLFTEQGRAISALMLNAEYRLSHPSGRAVVALLYPEWQSRKLIGFGIVCLYPTLLTERLLGSLPGVTLWLDGSGGTLAESLSGESSLSLSEANGLFPSEGSGSMITQLGDRRVILAYTHNAQYGTSLVNVHCYGESAAMLQQDVWFFLLIGLGVLLVGAVMSYILSRRLYRPINSLTEALAQTRYAGSAEKGEITMMSHAYRQMLDDINGLQRRVEDYLPHLRENFLRQMLVHGLSEAECAEGARKYKLTLEEGPLMVLALRLEGDHADGAQSLLSLLDGAACVTQALSPVAKVETARISGREMAFVLRGDQEQALIRLLRGAAHDALSKRCQPYTLAVAALAGSYAALSEAWMDALELLKYRFVLGDNQVIDHQLLENTIQRGAEDASGWKTLLVQTWHSGQRDLFEDAVMRITERLSTWPYQEAYVEVQRLGLVCYEEARKDLRSNTLSDLRLGRFLTDARDCRTLYEFTGLLLRLLDTCREAIRESGGPHNSKRREMALSACKAIAQRYQDPDLSVEQLAAQGGYSPNYFSSLFKSEVGTYLNDYIRKTRMAKAMELLTKTELSVQQIAAQTGFRNANYFFTTFKKETGVTPLRYRERDRGGEE